MIGSFTMPSGQAVLDDDGNWQFPDPAVKQYLNMFFSPAESSPADGMFGVKVLTEAAQAFQATPEITTGVVAEDVSPGDDVKEGAWDEHKHPRGKGGEFAGKGSGDSGGGESHPLASKAQKMLAGAKAAPAKLAGKARDIAVNKFKKFEARYGRKGAIAIMAASLALTPVPVPGTSLVPVLVAEGIMAASKLFKAGDSARESLEPSDLAAAVREYLAEVYAAAGEQMPEISDQAIQDALNAGNE